MKKIVIISTGGTFNKIYNPKNGELEIDKNSSAISSIAKHWLCRFEIINIIGKDSLDMNQEDRQKLLLLISTLEDRYIIVVHGTDTMDITAKYLSEAKLKKSIIITGAMVPYSINPVEATANLTSAYGYINAIKEDGVYIAMNGVIGSYDKIKKDYKLGKFKLLV